MKTQEQIIRELIGETCWRAWRGVGTAVFFEFGEKLADRKGGEARKGTYTIGLSCPWQIFQKNIIVFNDTIDLKELDQKILLFNDLKVTEINFDLGLHEDRILFKNGLEIHNYHNRSDDQWHIVTPDLECIFYKDKTVIGPIE